MFSDATTISEATALGAGVVAAIALFVIVVVVIAGTLCIVCLVCLVKSLRKRKKLMRQTEVRMIMLFEFLIMLLLFNIKLLSNIALL